MVVDYPSIGGSKNATIGSNTIVADGDSLGRIDFRGYNSNGNSYNQGATIEAKVDGSVGSTTDMPTAILFKTSEDGSASPTERLRITSDGKLLAGHTASRDVFKETRVQISGSNGDDAGLSIYSTESGVSAPNLILGHSRNGAAVDDGDILGDITFVGHDGTDLNSRASIIRSIMTADGTNNSLYADLVFFTKRNSGGYPEESLRVAADGKVGIGDDAPDALLSIKGDSDAATNPSIRLKDGTDTREAWITNAAGDLILANGGNDNTPHCYLKMFDGNIMTFATSNTERLRIGSAGQIGLGGANYGSSGQVLTSNGSGSAPTWQTVSGGGSSIGGSTGVDFNDNVKVRFGDDNDMEQFFDGTRLKITPKTSSTTSQLDFEAKDQVYIASLSNGVFLRANGQSVIDMYGGSGGGIYFHHNGNDKLKLEGGNWTTQVMLIGLSGTNYNIVFDASDSALEFADNARAKFGTN